jgi:hypothetical protein
MPIFWSCKAPVGTLANSWRRQSRLSPGKRNADIGPSVRRGRGRMMLRLTGIPFRKAPGAEYRTAAPRLGEWGRNALNWPNWGGYIVHILGCSRLYAGRTGPDSSCFREFPVFARAGIRFESHLGHSVSASQGLLGLWPCTNLLLWALRGPIFVGGCRCGRILPFVGVAVYCCSSDSWSPQTDTT